MPDYTYYTEKYLGEDIPEAAFPRFARRAAEELARMQNIYPMVPCKGIEPDTGPNAMAGVQHRGCDV